ncbi:unnamed protein product [Cylindrotheca closterium]|uniref:CSD domain-containing protein n=1 Tax=Cylindrotheca closterium TaxID=2856 RepID=A0AAD2FMF9_9STRA|nr:unnamed protein product [Cylindrotheca closterium]
MPEKIQGTVKWFSNRKGFGFITPTGDDSPTKDDIFVHQSNIVMEKEGTYRTIKDGMEVQFEVTTDEDGKLKAQNVTSADGSPCPIPEPRERRRRRKKADSDTPAAADDTSGVNETQKDVDENSKQNTNSSDKPAEKKEGRNRRRKNNKKGNSNTDDAQNENSNKAKSSESDKKPAKESLESILESSVKEGLESKDLKIVAGKTFIAIGDARIKLGSGGYTAFGHADGVVAEGKYTCDSSGKITAEWEKVLKLENAEWQVSTVAAETKYLVTEFNLGDDNVVPPKGEEDDKPIWGEGKVDPKEALESNGFLMRNIVFHPSSGGRRRRNRGRRNNKKEEGQKS